VDILTAWLLPTLLAAALLLGLAWRLVSRRRSLPCPTWLAWMVERDNPFTRTNQAASILGLLDLAPGMAVLDVGCGPGRLTVPVARQVGPQGEVVAMDLQPGMLKRAREKAQAAGLGNIRFVQAGAGQGQLPRGRFDRALLVTVLGEIPDGAAAFAEIFATLKPGGILSVTEIILDPHFQRRQTVVGLAGAAGFRERAFFGNALAYTLHLEKPGPTPGAE
jgi:2-polyprenyl-3-methyl-5-hydroxy-6-metoxy-1,4-benzoquinol methylase